MPTSRTLLVLSRGALLPTVWSNCLAGWLLAGGGGWPRFWVLCAGATCLYLASGLLNDAFDAEYDLMARPQRPVPSKAIRLETVWRLGFILLGAGWLSLAFLSEKTATLGLSLALAVVLYNAIHRVLPLAPVVMALCRLLLYLVAASASAKGLNGLTVWSALVLAAYTAGVICLARAANPRIAPPYWPAALLAPPLVLALVVNSGGYLMTALAFAVLLGAWTLRNLQLAWWSVWRSTPRALSGLAAGMVLVDWLAVADHAWSMGWAFGGLFFLTLLLQRRLPSA